MIVKQIISVSIFLISLSTTAQEIRLIGTSNQKPVVGALIQVANQQYVSNINGSIITDQRGNKEVIVTHISYETYNQNLLITSGVLEINLISKEIELNEVIITGQFEPQSAKNSVYHVRSIHEATIKATGATTLPEVLNTQLNVKLNRDNATGSSNLSLQGISGQNVKVLLDGVPLSGRSGTQNEIDISQIDINTIERIELVEGPMSVMYGADALAGVVNIITKKEDSPSGSISVGAHEETVAQDIALLDEGIHNFNISGSKTINETWHIQLGGAVNKFGGWQGNDPNYNSRNRLWYPKTQYFGNGLIRYSRDKFELHYRSDYSNSSLTNLGAIRDNDLRENTAIDEEYRTSRWMQQVQSSITLDKGILNSVVSFSRFERSTYQYNKYLESGREVIEENMRDEQDSSHLNSFFSRVTYNTSLTDKIKLLIGLDATVENGAASKLTAGNKSLTDINFYASGEWQIGKKLMLRPGIRYGYHSVYRAPITPSLNMKYAISDRASLRVGYGRGFRAPALTELYYEFVDANHRIFGNEDLQPEYSHNVNAQFTHETTFEQWKIKLTSGTFYNYIDNRISFITPESNNPDNNTILTNLLKYKTTGGTIGVRLNRKNTSVDIHTGFTGRYQQLNESEQHIPEFVFSHELATTLRQEILWIKTTLSANYKFTGPVEQYVINTENVTSISKTEGFHWLNVSASKKIGKSIDLIIGVKNLLDLQDISVLGTTTSGSAHGGGGSTRSIGYGRSYFIKLNYQLNFK